MGPHFAICTLPASRARAAASTARRRYQQAARVQQKGGGGILQRECVRLPISIQAQHAWLAHVSLWPWLGARHASTPQSALQFHSSSQRWLRRLKGGQIRCAHRLIRRLGSFQGLRLTYRNQQASLSAYAKAGITCGALSTAGDLLAQTLTKRHARVGRNV